jgi:hypothetical protein
MNIKCSKCLSPLGIHNKITELNSVLELNLMKIYTNGEGDV